jgi:Rrf2 family iron-sulfur cluster assembly transcriptional regulator
MVLTTKSKYAVAAILEIASRRTNSPVQLKDISEKQNITPNYLNQIFKKLRSHNIVSSSKGPGGGYMLTSDPRSIKIHDIINAVEEKIEMTRCGTGKCINANIRCSAHKLWHGLNSQIKTYLKSISIDDVIQNDLPRP